MVGNEGIQRIEVCNRFAVHLDHAPGLEAQARRRVVGAVDHGQTGFRPRLDEGFAIDFALIQRRKAA